MSAIAAVPQQTHFDYESLERDDRSVLRQIAGTIHKLARVTAQNIVTIGGLLIQAKARVGHGKFLEWIRAEFAWTARHAQNFMNVYERFKCENFSHLTINVSALYLIAAPKTPEPARSEVIKRAVAGEKITRATALRVINEFKKEERPAPDEARRMAIETGKSVLDSEGWFQPPVSLESQQDLTETLDLLEMIAGFPQSSLLQNRPVDLIERFAQLRYPLNTKLRHASLDGFIAWLTEFEHERKARCK